MPTRTTKPTPRSSPATSIPPISTLNWLLTFLFLAIPLLNIPLILVGAFAPGIHPNKRTYCRASIIVFLILVVIPLAVLLATGLYQNIDWPELLRSLQQALATTSPDTP